MTRKAWIVAVMVLCFSFPALAQTITVTGTVTDATGEPLIGASVIAKGTSVGAATDFDGNYSLSVDPKATLIVSYVGYDTQEIPVDGRTNINVVLKENSVMLNEVVAIGYGSVKKSDATGAVSAIKPSEVQAGLATSAQDLLVGRSPGVVVTTNGGQPEGGASIQIRGGASLSASNEPLIVIDGVPMDTKGTLGSSNPMSLVNPENIESMTILKDASATAIFGSRASNGVIIITTKKGSSGAPVVNFAANMYINTPRNYVDMMNASEFSSFILTRYGEGSSQVNALGDANTNWQKEVLRTTVSSDYNLSVGGTYKVLPYRVSVSYTNNNGIVNTTKMDRATVGINLSPKFFDGLLSVNANVRGAYINNRFFDGSALGASVSFNPTLPVYAPEGNVFNNYTTYVGTRVARPTDAGSSINTIQTLNPVSLINEYNSSSKVYQSIGNLQLDLAMPFLRELHANLNLGYDLSRSNVNNIWAANSPMSWKNGSDLLLPDPDNPAVMKIQNVKDGEGRYFHEHQVKANLLLDFYLNYKKDFDAISSNLDATAGYSWQSFRWQGNSFTQVNTGEHKGFQAYPTNYYRNDLKLVSFFGRINYTFMDRYLATVTLRQDGTSRFSKNHRWGTFPSVSLAWRIIDEAFMEPTRSVLSDLKIRASWGITGQQDIGDDFFPYMPIYTIGNNGNSAPNTTAYPNIIPDGKGGFINVIKPNGYNSDIKWEETTTWNFGIDFGFLNNRIAGNLEVYKRKTKDLLTWATVPAGSNLTNAMNTNIGDLENTGIEFNINTRPIVTRDFTWTSDFNISWNKNKITKLTDGDDPGYFIATGGISAGTGTNIQAHMVGHPAYSFYVYQQVYDVNGDPIEGQFVDRNGDGQITEADKYIYHSRDPKVVFTWNNTFNYKNWDFGMVLRANIGNWVYNDFEAANTSISSTSSAPLSNLMSNRFLFNDLGVRGVQSDYFVRNASFLRCDNITIGYTWPNLLNDALRLRLYGAVQNPFVITKYNGLDPEVFGGIDNAVYPRPVTVSFGIVAQF
ncbi:TonB-dependent receptor [Muribaculum gordoncarteri]|uniref:TonB-dependent receptor n=11 Tax=Muribaculum TaxID=1918540 RepID=A0A4P7VR46_9BACT|nr:TonB-dependent receptor [Muribaculum gordoncarteri]QCD36807.1 TonB-dependent receptor [Muribaculum gordoncarteri]